MFKIRKFLANEFKVAIINRAVLLTYVYKIYKYNKHILLKILLSNGLTYKYL